ncbi:MAG: efflux RND transporter periplasmic adaptor subunit [Clostridia bacterium]|nr:efflux RND transporter periplasmic adaptor subunit [Clostridia bacterium]MDD4047314.1 efflux RND transporter periplasmic adaptor subunit [Clostridia bacterium]
MNKKRVAITLSVIMFMFVTLAGCNSNKDEANKQVEEKKIPVTVETVHRETLEKKIPLGGLLQPEEEVIFAAKNPAFKIMSVPVEVGNYVLSGTPLVVFDTRDIDLQLNQAQLAYDRNKQLYEINAISKFQLEQSEIGLENLKLQKENGVLTSTVNGIVSSVSAVEGQLAGGAPLVAVVNIDSLDLEVQVGEAYISELQQGSKMDVSVAAVSEKPFRGVITNIAPQVDSRTKAYPVTLNINNRNRLIKGGMYGEIEMLVEKRENILTIPQYAVLDYENKYIVYVIEDERAKMREIQLGLTLGEKAEVLQGLSEGEQLIVEGQYGVKDGSLVAPTIRGEE